MGNLTSSTAEPIDTGKEMNDSSIFSFKENNHSSSLVNLDELSDLCQKLKESVDKMSHAITDIIFDDPNRAAGGRDDENNKDEGATSASVGEDDRLATDNTQIQMNLVGIAQCVQLLIQELTEQLNQHAKHVGSGENVKLIFLVKSLVRNVNDYMAMLIRNIRKIRQLMNEDEGPWKARPVHGVFDIIEDSQDVDAMLMELSWIEQEREQLENNALLALLHYRNAKKVTHHVQEMVDLVDNLSDPYTSKS